MKALGLAIISVAFIYGSWVAVIEPTNLVDWKQFAPAWILGFVGVVLAHQGRKSAASDATVVEDEVSTLTRSLDRVCLRIDALNKEKRELDVYGLHERIDAEFREDLTAFADARKSMIPAFGLQAYAEIMNEFAAGERYLNRVWCCSVDGYLDEAHTYIARANEQFTLAHKKLSTLRGSS